MQMFADIPPPHRRPTPTMASPLLTDDSVQYPLELLKSLDDLDEEEDEDEDDVEDAEDEDDDEDDLDEDVDEEEDEDDDEDEDD